MKILVLGVTGMVGHKMFQNLSQEKKFDVYGAMRGKASDLPGHLQIESQQLVENFDVLDPESCFRKIASLKPDVILNCVGITLRKPEINDLPGTLKVNARFPQYLRVWCETFDCYLIHFSTDCVFSGKEAPYSESSRATAEDNYGVSKFLGEVSGTHSLTLRGSMIGPEIFGKSELLAWALSQRGKEITGFRGVIYSGVTTVVMANLVTFILLRKDRLLGLYQVSSEAISKYDLLRKLNATLELGLTVHPDDSRKSSKVLRSDKIQSEIGFVCPGWDEMLIQLKEDMKNYSELID